MNTDRTRLSAWDRIMMAITFAEAGEDETARELLNEKRDESRPEIRTDRQEQRPEIRA